MLAFLRSMWAWILTAPTLFTLEMLTRPARPIFARTQLSKCILEVAKRDSQACCSPC